MFRGLTFLSARLVFSILVVFTVAGCEQAVQLTVLNNTNEEIYVDVNGKMAGVVPPLANRKLDNKFFPDSSFLVVAYDQSRTEISRQRPLLEELRRVGWKVRIERGRSLTIANSLEKTVKLYVDGIGRDYIKAAETVLLNGLVVPNSLGEHLVEARDMDGHLLFSRVISETLMAVSGWSVTLDDRK